MKLAYWQYAGPAHIGTLRVASSFHNIHAMMHGPLGDDYFNVMRSMLERERDFTPVTASIVDRHVLARGSQDRVIENMGRKNHQEKPDLMVLTPTCTSSILQEDLHHFVERVSEYSPAILADVNHYRINEIQAADKTLEQIVRFAIEKQSKYTAEEIRAKGLTVQPSVNIIGIFTLGFHAHHDCRELRRLFHELGVEVNAIIPEGATVESLQNLPKAWVNIVPYREVGIMTANYLKEECGMPFVGVSPFGLLETKKFLQELKSTFSSVVGDSVERKENFKKINFEDYTKVQAHSISQSAWFSRSIDCQNLTGKKAIVFGDATHAAGMTKVLTREMGVHVVCAGTYCKHDSDWFYSQVHGLADEILVTDDHTQVGSMISRLEPAAIFGTQMERHIGKRLGIPCGVISAPVHIQNFPLGYRPFLGYEGTNNIADLIYNTYTLGMEDHLLEVFGGHDVLKEEVPAPSQTGGMVWAEDAHAELQTIPGFVRGKVKSNTEKFAEKQGFTTITRDVLYQAKEAATA